MFHLGRCTRKKKIRVHLSGLCGLSLRTGLLLGCARPVSGLLRGARGASRVIVLVTSVLSAETLLRTHFRAIRFNLEKTNAGVTSLTKTDNESNLELKSPSCLVNCACTYD